MVYCSNGSEIRAQHDTVTGLACVEPGEGLVDTAHREALEAELLHPNFKVYQQI